MNRGIFFEFIEFLMVTKKWWLAPLIIVLLLFGLLIILGSSYPVSPFIYGMI